MLVQGTLHNDLTTSGQFIELERCGQLSNVSLLIEEWLEVATNLAEVNRKVHGCNDPTVLAAIAKSCLGRKKNFEAEIKRKVIKLEARKRQMQSQMQRVEQQIREHGLTSELPIPCVAPSFVPKARRVRDPIVAFRNSIIEQNLDKPHHDICRILDFEFERAGEVPEGCLPWNQKYGVKTFCEAYRDPRCRPLVHKMFSAMKAR